MQAIKSLHVAMLLCVYELCVNESFNVCWLQIQMTFIKVKVKLSLYLP